MEHASHILWKGLGTMFRTLLALWKSFTEEVFGNEFQVSYHDWFSKNHAIDLVVSNQFNWKTLKDW